MSKLFRYRQINSLFSSSLPFFKSRQFCPSIKFYLSTKQQEKTQKKIEKEKLSENVAKLETMADQEELTQETIKKLIALRREEINSVAAETDIPKNALITAAVITLPVLIGGPLINIFCMQNLFMQYTPAILAAYLKYSAVHLNFMVKKKVMKKNKIYRDRREYIGVLQFRNIIVKSMLSTAQKQFEHYL